MTRLWLVTRGIVFTILVPGLVFYLLPSYIEPDANWRAGIPALGWPIMGAGVLIYLFCLSRFLEAGGTPAIFFSRSLRFLIGEEPRRVVSEGLYRFSRNPMYLGVVLAIAGEAIACGSTGIAVYAGAMLLFFHLMVVFVEEPHLRATRGTDYERYVRSTPRWLGWRR